MSIKTIVAILVAAFALAGGAVLPAPPGVPEPAVAAAGLTLATIVLLATGALPLGITAVGFLLFAMLLQVQPAAVVFSDFASGAFWLVFGGLVVGVAVQHTGFGERLAGICVARIGGTYLGVLIGIGGAALALAFLMPSVVGRIVLLVPLVLAIADTLGFGEGSRGRTGMVMTACLISFTPSGTILPAHLASVILAGQAETLYGIRFTYGGFLITHFPVMGLLRAGLIVGVAWWLFGDEPRSDPARSAESVPMTSGERRLVWILSVALVLWMTDALHGIGAAWIAMAAAFVVLQPALNLVPANTLNERLDYSSLLYTAAVIGLGTVIAGSGLAGLAGRAAAGLLTEADPAPWLTFMGLSGLAALLGLVVTNPGIPAVLSPLAGDLAGALNLPVELVLNSQVFGFTNVILPYQASPILIGVTMARVPLHAATKTTLTVTGLSLLILLPVEYAWWRLLGMGL